MLRSVADAILTLDVDGRIASGNDAVERALGWAPAALRDRSVEELCADDRSRRRAVQLRDEVLRSAASPSASSSCASKDGGALVAEVSALLLADDEERPAGMIWRVHDLTERRRGDAERKRLQARLLHTERLSALGEMAARIAHEVRNPLVSIGAAAQVVAEELGAASPVAGEVGAIAREVKRLDAIVTDFLQFRAAAARRAARRAIWRGVVDETAALVRAKAPEQRAACVNVERPLIGALRSRRHQAGAAQRAAQRRRGGAEVGRSTARRRRVGAQLIAVGRRSRPGRPRPRARGACSIRSSRPRRAAPASGWRSPSRSSTSTTAASACSTGAAAARALSSSCR